MTDTTRREGTVAPRRSSGHLPRALLVLLGGLVLVPAMTTSAALQDMTSLLEGSSASSRWQSYFLPSPAGSIEKATVGFAEGAVRDRLPKGAGIATAGGAVYAMDTVRPAFDSPDEARVTRSQKAARVIAISPQAPPKAFSAGSILERQSLLRPSLTIVGPDIRTAFAIAPGADKAIAVAMNFKPKRPAIFTPEAEAAVMVASLERKAKKAAAADTATTTALGYAPDVVPGESRAAALFGTVMKPSARGFVPPIGKNDHSWAATPLPTSAYSAKEQTCLATGIYFEARGENEVGQAAVAQVILNRVRNPTYPNTICGVVYQNDHWKNRCQFSFACDGIKDRITNKRAYSTAKRIADEVTRGETWLAEVGSATHYHANYVKPRWARSMKKVDRIGLHIFYRTFGGGWK